MNTITFHIGYAKTGTTFMQEHVYPKLDGINYGGRFVNRYNDERDNLPWVYEFAQTAEIDQTEILQSLSESSKLNHLISHEVLMRPHKLDKALSALASFSNERTRVKIILSIRNPIDLVFSRYVHDIMTRVFGNYPLEKALDFNGTTECLWPMCGNGIVNKLWRKSPFRGGSCLCNQHKLKTINVPYYNLSTMHDRLTALFGKTNVHYMVLERLKEHQALEIDRLCNFLSTDDEKVKINHSDLGRPNTSNKRSDLDIYKSLKAENESNGVLENLRDYYAKANKEFSQKAQIDGLEAFNYF